jgi:hypothetical protein
VQHGDGVGLDHQVLGVGGDRTQRLGRRLEQDGVDYGLGVEGDLGRRWDIRRSSRPCATRLSMPLVSPDSMFLPQLNSIEPPWYGPVCQMVWEGWHREVSPHPDQSLLAIPANAAML